MGGEESKAKQKPQQQQVGGNRQGQQQIAKKDVIQEEYDGIPPAYPLIRYPQGKEAFPPDLQISSGSMPVTHKLVTDYFYNISSTVNKNEDIIISTVKKQMEEYISMANVLDKRRNELDNRLAKMLSLFRQFDTEIVATTDALKNTIEKADALAKEIDETCPSFEEFKTQ